MGNNHLMSFRNNQILLSRTKRFIVSKILEEQVFPTDRYSSILFKGPVIALEFCHPTSLSIDDCTQVVQEEVLSVVGGTAGQLPPSSAGPSSAISSRAESRRSSGSGQQFSQPPPSGFFLSPRNSTCLQPSPAYANDIVWVSPSIASADLIDLIFNSAN